MADRVRNYIYPFAMAVAVAAAVWLYKKLWGMAQRYKQATCMSMWSGKAFFAVQVYILSRRSTRAPAHTCMYVKY